MKKQTILIFVGVLVVVIVAMVVVVSLRSRESTSIKITSISPSNSSADQSMRVHFKVFGGADDFSIVVLPDTQHYSDAHPEMYYAQTQWIADNIYTKNIIFVSHLGDIVQNNDYFEDEWKVADAAMSTLDGIVPYGILPGNHDMQFGGAAQYYNYYFPESRFDENSWWGGSFNENKNNYQLITAAGDHYIIMNMQYCPSTSAINWTNEVLSNYSEYKAIITTHSYLHSDGSRVGHCQEKSDGENTGFDIWKKVVRQNPNIFLVLSGHIPGAARRADAVDGRVVYQLLSDYQDLENGGNGFLRIMKFRPNLDNIQVTTYSPALDSNLTDLENQFDLSFDMSSGRLPSGRVTISNGLDSCTTTIEKGYCDLDKADGDSLSITATYSGDLFFKGSVSH